MPRKKTVTLCVIEREEVEEEHSQAIRRIGRAIPIMAALSERLARKDALVARLPTSPALFQEPKLFFCDDFNGPLFEWLDFDPGVAEEYARSYHTLSET